MALTPGSRLGVYEITAPIGEGGMGQVFRARDTKLDRQVAIKILPEAFAHDADRLARFTREAKTLASLNHPNIAAIYGLEESAGITALVMELVEGDTLADRLVRLKADTTEGGNAKPVVSGFSRTGIPIDEALAIAKQIADALEAAHEQGIVHRDLKPANIKVRADGTVKVLDFGLAKAMDPAGTSSADAMNSPTLSVHGTMQGVILGTAAYMAPEQARGKTVDKRADIWAFGVVLYEMLTGRAAFAGDTITDIIAALVSREPDWTALPAATPETIRRLLARCLEKDPKRRLRDIGDVRFELEGNHAMPPATSATSTPRPWLWMAAALVFAVTTIALAVTSWRGGGNASTADSFELAIAPPAGAEFHLGDNLGNVILSPDGTTIAFVAATSKATTLWLRSLATDDARPLPGTEGAFIPFWSPDGRRIGFFASGGLTLGAPTTLFKLPAGDGSFTVNGDGSQFVAREQPFAAGQTLRVLTNWEKRLAR